MKPLLWEQTDHSYGRTRSASCPFDKVVREVYQGLRNGTIPSKISSDHDREAYGYDWIFTEILSGFDSINDDELFEESMRDCYPETT